MSAEQNDPYRMESLPKEFLIKLTPRSSRNEVVGWDNGVLRVKVHAPPVDGRANDALIEVLSDYSGLPKSAFRIVQGAGARLKRVRVEA